MASKRENPSSILSKKLIFESFLDMLAVKPLSSISISEIAENANVDRRTFYRHFKSKNDVIRYYIRDVSKKYENKLFHYAPNYIYSNVRAIFETLLFMKETLLILHKQNLLDMFISEFNIILEKYQYKYAKSESLKLENVDYYAAYERGGLTEIVKKWISENCVHSPDKMGKLLEKYFSLGKQNDF